MWIPEIKPCEAYLLQSRGALLLDVREDQEREVEGAPEGAIATSLSEFEVRIAELALATELEILTICAHGRRSLVAAGMLRQLGYTKVSSVQGGFEYWRNENLPVINALNTLKNDAMERYSRHLRLPEIGVKGQEKLAKSKVAIVGLGGLGSPAALYLAAAGVGHLTIIDNDQVDRSNLQRQILHSDDRVGMLKTDSAEFALSTLNPSVYIDKKNQKLQSNNVEKLIRSHDVIIDGADNFPARYLLNAASQKLKIPLVYGAVHRFSGQVSVFDPCRTNSPCYRCLFPEPPTAEDAPNCTQTGVLGVVPGIIGLLQANEVIKLLVEIGESLIGRLLCFDALSVRFREVILPKDPDCPGCSAGITAPNSYEDFAPVCRSE